MGPARPERGTSNRAKGVLDREEDGGEGFLGTRGGGGLFEFLGERPLEGGAAPRTEVPRAGDEVTDSEAGGQALAVLLGLQFCSIPRRGSAMVLCVCKDGSDGSWCVFCERK